MSNLIVPTIIVHGGAGAYASMKYDHVSKQEIEAGVQAAAIAGYNILKTGSSSVDAVEAAVVELENNPIFNAGKGSCLTIDGVIEMDASIMDGSTFQAGGVACIQNVLNPIKVARLVMDKSDHVLFCGAGALNFAKQHGINEVTFDDLVTEKARSRLATFPKFQPSVTVEFYEKMNSSSFHPDGEDHDTVGAVAIDANGNVAYATSTGGISAKLNGRVGDSPLIGCGGYADNGSGAVSTTGHGESFMKTCLAKHIAMLMEQGKSAQEAVEIGLKLMLQKVNGDGGCIALDAHGDIGIYFTSEGMAWSYCRDNSLHYGIYKGEDMVQSL